jgi:hypothetical protein
VFSIFLSLFSPTFQNITHKNPDTLILVEDRINGGFNTCMPSKSVDFDMSDDQPLSKRRRGTAEGNGQQVLYGPKVDDFRKGQIDHAQLM